MTVIINGSSGITDVDGTASAPALTGTDTDTGTFFPAANTIAWSTGGTERVRVDSSGNVGIGTSSPSVPFQLRTNPATAAGIMAQINPNTSTNSASLNFNNGGSGSVYIGRASSAGTGPSNSTISAYDTFFWNDGAQNIVFGTNNVERARFDSAGRFLLGTTSTILSGSNLLCASSSGYTAAFSTSGGASYHALGLVNTGTTGTRYYAQFYVGGTPTNTGGISTSDGTTTVYATSSDYRLKENVQPMMGALSVVSQLKPVTYTWKSTSQASQGFIAHELQAVVPEAVVGEKDAVDADGNPVYQGIDTSFLVATLTAAIQELKAELDATKAEVAALKEKI